MATAFLGAAFSSNPSRFVFLADLHIGEGCNSSALNYTLNDTDCYSVRDLVAAVEKINSVVGNTSFVIVGGDITSSAQRTEFEAARHWLSYLQSPFIATIGNHDIWSYDSISGDRTKTPKGDLVFSSLFHDMFTRADTMGTLIYPNKTANAHFHGQSWEFKPSLERFGPGMNSLLFVAPDFNTREKAIPPYDGVLGMAKLNNFTGGSWPWFVDRLAAIANQDTNVSLSGEDESTRAAFLVTHQPFRCRFGVPDWSFCFSHRMKAAFRTMVEGLPQTVMDSLLQGAQLAGHQHRWFDGTCFDEDAWKGFRQFETSAVKGDVFDKEMSASFMVFHISNDDESLGQTLQIDRYWREDKLWQKNSSKL